MAGLCAPSCAPGLLGSPLPFPQYSALVLPTSPLPSLCLRCTVGCHNKWPPAEQECIGQWAVIRLNPSSPLERVWGLVVSVVLEEDQHHRPLRSSCQPSGGIRCRARREQRLWFLFGILLLDGWPTTLSLEPYCCSEIPHCLAWKQLLYVAMRRHCRSFGGRQAVFRQEETYAPLFLPSFHPLQRGLADDSS